MAETRLEAFLSLQHECHMLHQKGNIAQIGY